MTEDGGRCTGYLWPGVSGTVALFTFSFLQTTISYRYIMTGAYVCNMFNIRRLLRNDFVVNMTNGEIYQSQTLYKYGSRW